MSAVILDQGHALTLTQGALGLVVVGVADHDDLETSGLEALHLPMDLGHERAGGIHDLAAPRRRASSRTAGATPWAENTTVAPSGTSSSSCTKTAPRCSRSATTWRLWTI